MPPEIPTAVPTDETPLPTNLSTKRIKWLWLVLATLFLTAALGAIVLWWCLQAPTSVDNLTVVVNPGESVSGIVDRVGEQGIVRSANLLYLITQLRYRDETIKTGTHTFLPGMNTFAVAEQLMLTTPADELLAITFPEGITVATMADIAAATLDAVDQAEFLALTAGAEGELWPETYFVPITYTTQELVTLLRTSQDEAFAELAPAVASSSLSEYEALILASIVEREANDETSMRMVAGILQNRLAINMPLQADATIEYVLDAPLGDLPAGALAENLRELDSPYNTYLNPGLPPTPIGNPGILAIKAVLEPLPSDYFFYITGDDGNFYYAETYDEHLINIEQHLR